jgi:hypothetical protein
MARKPPPKKKAAKAAPPAPVKPLSKKKPKGKAKLPTLGGGLMGLGGTGASGMMP